MACRLFAETGACRYGDACRFAHGGDATSTTSTRSRKKPAAVCFTFADTGACRYGDACRFAHAAPVPAPAAAATTALSPTTSASTSTASEKTAHTGGMVLLFIAGLPQCERTERVKRRLKPVLAPFRPRALRLGATHEGHTRGYAHVTVPAGLAAAAVAALDGAVLPPNDLCDTPATLTVGLATGKRDTLFAHLPHAQREALQLDSVAVYSVMDGVTAARVADVTALLLRVAAPAAPPFTVLDTCACVGGAALAYAALPASVVAHVAAVELDETRAAYLAHNARVCGFTPDRLAVVCGDGAAAVHQQGHADATVLFDVVFADPPWGGQQYSKHAVMPADALALGDLSLPALAALVRAQAARGAGPAMLVLATPHNYDDTTLARLCTTQRDGEAREADRPLPFRLEFGARVMLFVCHPPPQPPPPPPQQQQLALEQTQAATPVDATKKQGGFGFATAQLDALVAALVAWNAQHAGEHHPRFFDWEHARWVSLSRWKGARPVRPLVAS